MEISIVSLAAPASFSYPENETLAGSNVTVSPSASGIRHDSEATIRMPSMRKPTCVSFFPALTVCSLVPFVFNESLIFRAWASDECKLSAHTDSSDIKRIDAGMAFMRLRFLTLKVYSIRKVRLNLCQRYLMSLLEDPLPSYDGYIFTSPTGACSLSVPLPEEIPNLTILHILGKRLAGFRE